MFAPPTIFDFTCAKLTVYLNLVLNIFLSICFDVFLIHVFVFCTPPFHFLRNFHPIPLFFFPSTFHSINSYRKLADALYVKKDGE